MDDTGAVVNHLAYDVFGNVLSATSTVATTDFGYTGKLFDATIGLQNNWNRWYDARVGKWVSEDPIGFEAGDANLGRYVGNNPAIFSDPTGLYYPTAPEFGDIMHDAFSDTTRFTNLWGYYLWHPWEQDADIQIAQTAAVGTSAIALCGVGTVTYFGIGSYTLTETYVAATFWGSNLVHEAAVLGTLTASQIQNLINSSGDRVVTVFTKLSTSPATHKMLYTSTSPRLCNQIQSGTIYVGRIPADLFNRLVADGKIWSETTAMGNVTERAWVITAEAMPWLEQYFQATGGDGLP